MSKKRFRPFGPAPNYENQYVVNVREVYVQQVRIEATSPEEAIRLVAEGEGKEDRFSFEFAYRLDPDSWTASKFYLLSKNPNEPVLIPERQSK